jgi:hypothetical protein
MFPNAIFDLSRDFTEHCEDKPFAKFQCLWKWREKLLVAFGHADYPAFSVGENFSHRRTHGPHTYADCCFARRRPIRTVVHPRVLNNQRRAARQLYCLSRTMRARWHDW